MSAASAALGLGTMAAVPVVTHAATLSANDARLVALADTMWAIHHAAEAHIVQHRGRETDESEDEFGDITTSYTPVEEELAATSATSMVGVLAKARALQVPILREDDSPGVGVSLADDLVRLHAEGALA